MKDMINTWVVENASWIKEVKEEYGKTNYIDVIFNQPEFTQLCNNINTHTLEEEGYVNGITDEKCDLIITSIRKTFD